MSTVRKYLAPAESAGITIPRRLVPDNLKTGVGKPVLYNPQINKSSAERASHYDTLVDPARASKPKDKPRVERPMPYVPIRSGAGGRSPRSSRCRPGALLWAKMVS